MPTSIITKHKTTKKRLYFDYQATTPCDPRVVEKMLPFFSEHFGNPHSLSHSYGWDASQAVENARSQISDLVHSESKEIIFTSGATESSNLALKGVADFYKQQKNHIITVATEHKCVLDTCRHLENEGFEVTYLPVQKSGLLDLNVLRQAIKPTTLMVSVMAVNNEIGVIQPLKEIGDICCEHGVFFHTDAAQAVGKMHIHVDEMKIDLLSISAHKVYGPKGIGALFVRRRALDGKHRVRLNALINGGEQERGMRSGTLAPALCVGFGEACRIASLEMDGENTRLLTLRERLYSGIMSRIDDVFLNGDKKQRITGNLNLSFAYVEGEGLMGDLSDLALSSGSACTSASLEPSYVLRALGVTDDLAHTSLRFGLGRFTTEEDVDYAITRVVEAVTRLRALSPLYEMAKEGVDIQAIQWDNH